MINNKKKIIIFGILAILILAIFFINKWISNTVLEPANGGRYTEGVVGFPEFSNPFIKTSNKVDTALNRLIFSSITKLGEDLKPKLDLALSYETDKDKKVYTFHLRKNILWHDGKKLTADDIVFTFNFAKRLPSLNQKFEKINRLKIEKIDELSFRIISPEPSPTLLSSLYFPILPKHIWENVPLEKAENNILNIQPIGSGPFIFKEIKIDNSGNAKSYTLKRNDYFYKKPPYLEEITFIFYPDTEKAFKALEHKEIQGIGFLPKNLNFLSNSENLNTYKLTLPQYVGLFFNLKNKNSPFSGKTGKSLRKALYSLVQKGKIPPVLEGIAFPVNSSLIDVYINPSEKQSFSSVNEYDAKKAENLLRSLGWKKTNQFWEKDGKTLEITITTPKDKTLEEVGAFLKKNWEKSGIKTRINIVSKNEIAHILKTKNFEALLYGVLGGLPSQQYAFWHSPSAENEFINLTGFSNRKADELLELSAISIYKGNEDYLKYLKEFQEIIADEHPAIFLYSPYYIYLVDKKIKGVKASYLLSPEDRLSGIENWYVKMKRVKKNS